MNMPSSKLMTPNTRTLATLAVHKEMKQASNTTLLEQQRLKRQLRKGDLKNDEVKPKTDSFLNASTLKDLIVTEFTQKELQKIHDYLSKTNGKSTPASIDATNKLVPYFKIIKSENLDKLTFTKEGTSINQSKPTDFPLTLLKNKCKKLDIDTRGKSTGDILLELYEICFPKKITNVISRFERPPNYSPRLPQPPKNTTETANASEQLEQSQRLDSYKESNQWNGNKIALTSLTLDELNETSKKLSERRGTETWKTPSDQAAGAENAFKNFILNPLLKQGVIEGWSKSIALSMAEEIGGDYILKINGKNYLIDVKKDSGVVGNKRQTADRYNRCDIAPIFIDGELDQAGTQKMLKDIIEFSLGN